jgi:nicotinate-nucleotide adenylyltransferase
MLQQLGILGGTFDPIHIGHLAIAEDARSALGLGRILFIPAGHQPLKGGNHAATPSQRFEMVALACHDNPAFEPSALEIERTGPSYTVTTLETLAARADATLHFILGADALADLPRWRAAEQIVKLARIAAIARPGYTPDLERLSMALPGIRERLTLIEGPALSISSSDLRQRVAEGRSIRYLTPDRVVAYINEHSLYREDL